ncbi:DUF1729 domain-containing protein, partial [Candidatus Bathyarchaeota archaeon]|nr:DUF1729 domain-containing protein [Candidatus Bathyarchaeota archaeon]
MYGASNGPQTGVSTPRSSASLRPLALTHGTLDTSFLVPTNLHFHASQLKERFNATLPEPTDELAQDDEPSSVPELLARYMGFIAKEVDAGEDDAQGSYEEVLKLVLNEFERAFLQGNEVHPLAASLPGIDAKKLEVIRSYYAARAAANRPIKPHQSALFRAADDNSAQIYTIFGGQGNIEEYFEELREINSIYPTFVGELLTSAADLLQSLARHPEAEKLYSKGLDVLGWLQNPEATPDVDYLISAPVSFPLIGLLQLAHYEVTCRTLGVHPGVLRDRIQGTTGHSQGVVIAAATAAAGSWDEWRETVVSALTVLFWIGARSQQTFPITSITPSMLRDSVDNGEGTPTPMLSIRDLSQPEVQKHIDATNHYLPADRHIGVSLVNSPRNMVVTGPPMSLYGLNVRLRKVKAPTGLDQNRIPHTDRKVRFANRFLPITAPFHSQYLSAATEFLDKDLADVKIDASSLDISLYDTNSGKDIRDEVKGNIVPTLIRLITRDPVAWEKATTFPDATHVLDFGPGGVSGIGVLTSRNKEGSGVRVVLAGSVEGTIPEVGYKRELFDRDEESAVKFSIDWVKEFGPKLVKTSSGRTYLDTRFSRLIGLPPIVVAGMTPTTISPEFMAATMNAGYSIELSGGGYFDPRMMEAAIRTIEGKIPPGRGININLIYVNPAAMSWQIPLLARLRAEGVPISGLTIGAGVPSIEVANEYIETIGVKHIAFKPGSVDAIQSVINIANANPTFPVILQWTGGRAGGHHSYEDFHQPVLQMYARIRRAENIILVAGSGFGGADDTYPYITGEWAKKFGYPPMPFDGCLFGSRMMVAKESKTSPAAKRAIIAATGIEDSEWEKTYKTPTGGILTVRSEMGEPIHKLATRGVLFWAEIDKKIFALPKEKRVAELQKNRDWVIRNLNDNFQKVWFGRNKAGKTVDLDEMTYAEVVRRMIELLYVKHESRWIDPTYVRLTAEWIQRVEERFTQTPGHPSLLQNRSDLQKPFETIERILAAYPESETQIVNAHDVEHFLLLCMFPFQKPVPFVPIFDDNFEFYFKKDSLWQSEDLEAVPDQDVERTCVLQGPVAVKYSTIMDEPVQSILDGIHEGHIKALTRDIYGGDTSRIPTAEYFGGRLNETEIPTDLDSLTVSYDTNKNTYRLSSSASAVMPPLESWLALLAGPTRNWRHALLLSDVVVQGQKYETNPIKRIFAPTRGLFVEIQYPNDPAKTVILVKEQPRHDHYVDVIEVKPGDADEIVVNLIKETTAVGSPVPMSLKFTYHPEAGYAPIHEVMSGRNDRIKEFYW